ncbi:TPA: hypothetical protein JZ506_002770, partial [Enterococcus faecium]|nr:hypothetical protein [Enterococcus faecium]
GNYHKCISIDENLLSQIIIKKGKDNIELTWIIHHLIIDNVSWKILLEDLERLYYEKDNEINSNLKTTTYNKWAKSISNYQNIGVCQYSCRIFIFHLSKSRTSLWSVGLVIQ